MDNSSYTKKEGQGSLFKNDKKTSPNQPDFTGSIMIGGVEKRIAAWNKTSRNGGSYLSISISDFQGAQQNQGSYNGGSRGGYNGGGYSSGSSYGGGNYGSNAPQAPAPAPGLDDMPADFGGQAPFEDLPF